MNKRAPDYRLRQMALRGRQILRSSPVGGWLADISRGRRSLSAIRSSGMFDVEWYREQAGASLPPGSDPVEHYLNVGSEQGLRPHPLFDPEYYVATSPTAHKSAGVADPFVEFVTRGCHRGDDPHPLFDTRAYLTNVPEAANHPHGAFGHFLSNKNAPWPYGDIDAADIPNATGLDAYLELVKKATRIHGEVPDYTKFQRNLDTFDHDAAAVFVRRMRDVVAGIAEPPTVSVIVPTKDRADVLANTVDSVRAQTYPHWELVIVDDGGTDSTGELVAKWAEEDPRIRYVYQENTGVAGARNHGIGESTGSLIAYLDSDNTWVPEFLEVMVGFLRESGLRAAYCASEQRGEDRVQYRGRPLDRGALRERNYIDCITLMQERSLVDEIGAFDERLRRVVDWDLLIRLAEVTDLGFAPFIGTSYDLWDDRTDRISLFESVGYRHIVRDKHLVRWEEAPEVVPGRLSVLSSANGSVTPTAASVRDLLGDLAEVDHEVILIDNGLGAAESVRLRVLELLTEHVRVLRLADPASPAVARNLAAANASGDVLLQLEPGAVLDHGSAVRLAEAVRGRAPILVQPTVINGDGTVRGTGQVLGRKTAAVTIGPGLPADDPALEVAGERDGVEGYAFAVDAGTFRALRGFDPIYVRGGGDLDLGLRAAQRSVRTVHDPDTHVHFLYSPKSSSWSPDTADRTEFARRWDAQEPRLDPADLTPGLAVTGMAGLLTEGKGFPRRWAPVLVRAPGSRRRWAIKTAVPNVNARNGWGDWHYGCRLRDALVGLGEQAVVDTCAGWHRHTVGLDDINVVLRGTQRFEPNPGRINLLWVISHPDLLTWYELRQFDRVYVASMTYPDVISARWPDIRAYPLLQATDPSRFYPEVDPSTHEDLLFVGNSRRVLRTIVRDTIEAGLRPSVYGSLWKGLIPDELVRGEYIPNGLLNRYYANANIVLNDHWNDMRERGFINNRLFDAVASGAVVVSDEIPGIDGLFDDRVITYSSPEDLKRAIDEARSRPPADPEKVKRLAHEHNFTARAREMVAAVDELMT